MDSFPRDEKKQIFRGGESERREDLNREAREEYEDREETLCEIRAPLYSPHFITRNGGTRKNRDRELFLRNKRGTIIAR